MAPLLLAGACETAFTGSPVENVATVTVLHTNDMHGAYMPFRATTDNATAQTGDPGRDTLITFGKEAEIGGFAYLASAIKKVRAEKGADNVLLVDGGDTFSDDQLANLTQGEAMIRLMNTVDYDLLALGNHDFDYGLGRTRELDELADFPMRAANIIDGQTGQPVLGEPYIISEKNGVKVAILALGYRNTPKTTNPNHVEGLQFRTGPEVAQQYVPEMRSKADVVVVLSHEGTDVDYKMAREVAGIDVIIGAHSHDILEPRRMIGQTFIVQALSDAAVLGSTELVFSGKQLVDVKDSYYWLWHDQWQPDPETQALVEELRSPYLSQLQEQVAESNDVIGRQYKSESPFDKLVGNLLNESYNSEVALLPGVGYGISLKPGPVTREQVYDLLPHSSNIVTLNLTGEQLKQTLEQSAYNLNPSTPLEAVGGLIQTAGLAFKMDLTQPAGQRVSEARVGNQPINGAASYRVVTHSGMLTGLHNYDAISNGQNINRTGKPLNEFVIEMLREKGHVSTPENMGEVVLKK